MLSMPGTVKQVCRAQHRLSSALTALITSDCTFKMALIASDRV